MSDLGFDLSGVRLRLAGLPDDVARGTSEEWRHFASAPPADPFLHVRVEPVDVGDVPASFLPKEMTSRFEPGSARFDMPEGTAEVRDGTARIRLGRDLGERGYYAFHNLLRACLAWRLPDRGAAMLHAAGLVVDGRAFVLVGPAGSGKSTWVVHGEATGARALSDDVVLVDRATGTLEALGAPFRSTHRREYRPGRWPVAAVLWPMHGPAPALTATPRLLARAKVAANLPFLADGVGQDERIDAAVDAVLSVPCLGLTFAPDAAFVPLLAGFPQ
jgi:hypothetical protein